LPEHRFIAEVGHGHRLRRAWRKGDSVASCCLHDSPDRVHDDVWLVDRQNVTGLLSEIRHPLVTGGLILLQLSPILLGSSFTGDEEDRDG
jgi:hypothetical protein